MSEIFTKNLPPKFVQNISGLYGARGKKWLEDLPNTLIEIGEKWSLKIDKVFPNLSFNFVAACTDKTGEKFVLKVGVPEKDSSIIYEKRALQAFDGRGAVKLLRFNKKLAAMLLERAVEGKTLGEICGEDYERAVQITIDVMLKLPRHPLNKNEFINLETWINGLNRAVKINFEPHKVSRAQKYFAELIEPFEKKILLHGDIHFDNILSAGHSNFLVIDPKGLVGEIGYEIGVFLNDLAGWTAHLRHRKEILEKAVKNFARAFDTSPKNLRKWAFSFAVLSAWWTMEDFGEKDERVLGLADIWDV